MRISDWSSDVCSSDLINAATPENQNLVTTLQKEWRQLRRYGGAPDLVLAGSDFLEAYEKELRAKGNYTDTGWANKGRIDASMDDVSLKGVAFQYDPPLSGHGREKYASVVDPKTIVPKAIEGENMKSTHPGRHRGQSVRYSRPTGEGSRGV